MKSPWLNFIKPIDIFGGGSIFDHNGGNMYQNITELPPLSNLLMESGYKILLENGDGLAKENI